VLFLLTKTNYIVFHFFKLNVNYAIYKIYSNILKGIIQWIWHMHRYFVMMIFLGRSILRLFFFRRLDNFLSLASIWSNFVTLNFWWDTMSRHFVRRCQDSKKGIIYFNRSNMTKHRRFDHQQVSIDFGMLFLCK
jgi:hypothetical protein